MPVLGHAFVGWTTALAVRPRLAASRNEPRAGAYWIPTLCALAYGPDIVAQCAHAFGWAEATRVTHSLVLAVFATPAIGLAIAALLHVDRFQAVAVTLGSVVAHDLLDLLQTPEREPLWPLCRWNLGESAAVIPASGAKEALLFGGCFVLYLTMRRLTGRPDRQEILPRHRFALVLATALVASAGVTHYLRESRERQLLDARRLVGKGRFSDAIAAASNADRWPSTAHPGRVDHVRAEALEELGDLDSAIAGYTRAVAADPANFWAVADLAAACAASPRPERRADASSLRSRLLRDFSSHAALGRALARIDRRLVGTSPGSVPQP